MSHRVSFFLMCTHGDNWAMRLRGFSLTPVVLNLVPRDEYQISSEYLWDVDADWGITSSVGHYPSIMILNEPIQISLHPHQHCPANMSHESGIFKIVYQWFL